MFGRKTRLVILAHNNNLLLEHDLVALSERFDDIVIIGWQDFGLDLELPKNARHIGSYRAYAPTGWQRLRRLLSPRLLTGFFRVLGGEWFQLRVVRHFRMFIYFCLEGSYVADLPGLRESVRDKYYDVTVLSSWASGPAYALPWLLSRSTKLTIRLHSIDLYEWLDRGYLPMRQWLYRRADLLAFASKHGMDYVVGKYPSVRHKSEVWRLGSPDLGLAPLPKDDVPVLVTCSSLLPVKRLTRLALALRLASRQMRWVHFGGGPLESELQEIAKGLPNVDVELRGNTPHAEVMRFYKEHPVDVFINVSDREAVAISISEAMSFGIPVVATAAGGTPEAVGAELGSGELIPVDFSDETLMLAIERVIAGGRQNYRPREVWSSLLDAHRNARDFAQRIAELARSTHS